jgi:membrane-associated phospholipid phosphatase
MSINYGFNATTKSIISRNRPLAYNKNTSDKMLSDPDTKFSFYSGHSSSAFASAVFNSILLSEMPQTTLRDIGIGLNLANATAIATLRVLAGKHFLSDVVVGAVIGSGIAYIITEVHREENSSHSPQGFTPARIGVSFGL